MSPDARIGIMRELFPFDLKTLEQEGLIYPMKGKGNFVADTQKIQEKYKEDFRSEFLELVKRGCRSGFEEKELLTLVQRGYKEE